MDTPKSNHAPLAQPSSVMVGSALAFILAYALVLESGSWRHRALTVLPILLVLIGWRLIYQGLGYGVAHAGGGINNVGGYIDPSQEPLRFAGQLVPRMVALAGGQLTGIPPDALLLLNAPWQDGLMVFYLGFLAAGCIVILPLLREIPQARFWFAVMVLALIPAATVTPLLHAARISYRNRWIKALRCQ